MDECGIYPRPFRRGDFIKMAMPYFEQAIDPDKFDLPLITRLIQPRLEVLNEIPEKAYVPLQAPGL